MLDAADELEFVDLPPEELQKRLAEGRVYLRDRAALPVRQFFRRGNLYWPPAQAEISVTNPAPMVNDSSTARGAV